VNAQQRRQFIPQGAVIFVGIAVFFVDIFGILAKHIFSGKE